MHCVTLAKVKTPGKETIMCVKKDATVKDVLEEAKVDVA
jgi:hypothetical protein